MALSVPEKILKKIDSLSPQEKDYLELLIDKKEKDELIKRMSLPRSLDINEEDLFD
ncbi:MAG TPA: hypothetical protein PLG34_09710 [Spirochaetota bacterium]|jgi:hypothetical protein|nr:MAG: hypothetical protein BWX91_02336 [Spirochaetes bacterium ADurb.Bin133]HPY88246.1 hypothetical protein [Spirochaetota bacterium]HQB61885.1 hypothetical protein [Spirochaetota bacterium]